MSRRTRKVTRWAWRTGAAGLLTALALTTSAGAQSGVVMGTEEELLHLLDNGGGIAVDFNVDDVNLTQAIVIGRADTLGFNEMDIDLVLIDNDSTLSNGDASVFFNSSDASLRLGSGSAAEPGRDGDLFVEDGLGITTIQINGDSGNIVQEIDNIGAVTNFDGNGAVKAWAIIDADGTVIRCWNCNTNASETQRLSEGKYEVDFTIGNIDKRPVLATRACATPGNPLAPATQCAPFSDEIRISPRLLDSSSIWVLVANDEGNQDDTFTLVVF